MSECGTQERPIDADQGPVDRVAVLLRDLAADQVTHEDWNERHGESRSGCHGVRLSERERCEQPSFLGLQREDGYE